MDEHQQSAIVDNDRQQILKAEEYKALRNEILKRVEFRYQIINLILFAAGTFISLGLQQKSASILLLYPILSFFLILSWMHNGITLTHIGQYIREKIEPGTDLGWETQLKVNYPGAVAFSLFNTLATSGLVISTQILSIVLALTSFSRAIPEILLLTVDIVIVTASAWLLQKYSRRRRL